MPDFKQFYFKKMSVIPNTTIKNDSLKNHFETISDFKWCMNGNAEVQFFWDGKTYTITQPIEGISISEVYKPETEKICRDADDVLEYLIDGTRLRDIITKVEVTDRTL